jgi:ankyrin repeat protein
MRNGAGPNNKGYNGETAIIRAVRKYDMGTVRVLIDAGADPLIKDRYGVDALGYAREYGYKDIVELFQRLQI